jgi:hypothetical protein
MPLPLSLVKDDSLLRALFECEERLHDWIENSAQNALWFARDPIGAIRAANVGMDEELLSELEAVAAGIAVKLK